MARRRDAPEVRRGLPWVVRWILAWLLPHDDRRAVAGDLEELYERRLSRDGERAAAAWLRRQIVQYPHRLLLERFRSPSRFPRPRNIQRNHSRSGEPMSDLLRDLRHGLRGLAKSPVLAATIVATVGLGIGATTVMLSVIHAVLLQPLPYHEPGELVRIYTDSPPHRWRFSVADYLALDERQTSFRRVAGYTNATMTFEGDDAAERVPIKKVTASYFPLLGISPLLGRPFDAADDEVGAEPTVIASHGFWSRRLGADPTALGGTLRLDGIDHRLIGVLPRELGPLEEGRQLFVAAQWAPPPRKGPFFVTALGRLAAERAVAAEELRAINRSIFPIWQATYTDEKSTWGMMDLDEYVIGDAGPKLFMALGAVAFVLLVASANAANLLVARTSRRRRELAVRGALGASRGRLLQHLLSESALLACGAAAVGLAVAGGGIAVVSTAGADYLPRAREVALTGPVWIWLAATAAGSASLFALIPAFLGARARLDRSPLAGGRPATGGAAARRLRQGLVMTQLAVATPLLVSAGLLLASLDKLERVDLGVDGGNVLTAAVLLPAKHYPEGSDVLAFWAEARERVAALPGVLGVAYADSRPPDEVGMVNNFDLEDHPTPPGNPEPAVPWVAASPEYFELMGIPLLAGRLLEERDGAGPFQSVVVDEAWARRFFPGEDAVGKRFHGGGDTGTWWTVAGVVGDVEYNGLHRPAEGTVYWRMLDRPVNHPIDQISQRFRYFVIRTAVEPATVIASLRRTVRELDPAVPVSRVATVDELVADSLATPRGLSLLVGAFALVALVLSVIGVYGVMAYFVHQHGKDIGIRMALGGGPSRVAGMVVGRGLAVVAAGVAAGLAGALALTRFMSSLLFEVGATDARTFAAVTAVVLATALAACLVPARRAAAVDPAVALREE